MVDADTAKPTLANVLSAAYRSWRRGTGAVPTTRSGAEIAVMVTLAGWRMGTLAQVLPAVPDGLMRSPNPALYALMVAMVVIESVAITWFVIRTRGFRSPKWAMVDVTVATVALLAQPWYISEADFIGTWIAWAPGFAINATVVAALGFTRRRDIAVAAGVLAVAYATVTFPHATGDGQMATVRSNVIAFAVFAVMSRAMVGFVRRFGDAADAARDDAWRRHSKPSWSGIVGCSTTKSLF